METRATDEHMTMRMRVCGNGHRFKTYEVHPTVVKYSKRDRAALVRRIEKSIVLWKRDLAIASDFRPAKYAAEKFGITPTRVSQIRRRIAALKSTSSPTKKGNEK